MLKKIILPTLLAVWTAVAGGVTQVEAGEVQTPSLSYLAKWEGRLPQLLFYDKDPYFERGLWADPNVKNLFKNRVGKVIYDHIEKGWDGMIRTRPVVIENNVLIASNFRPRSRLDMGATLFVDLETNKTMICWRGAKGKMEEIPTSTAYTPEKTYSLEPEDCYTNEGRGAFNKIVGPKLDLSK